MIISESEQLLWNGYFLPYFKSVAYPAQRHFKLINRPRPSFSLSNSNFMFPNLAQVYRLIPHHRKSPSNDILAYTKTTANNRSSRIFSDSIWRETALNNGEKRLYALQLCVSRNIGPCAWQKTVSNSPYSLTRLKRGIKPPLPPLVSHLSKEIPNWAKIIIVLAEIHLYGACTFFSHM